MWQGQMLFCLEFPLFYFILFLFIIIIIIFFEIFLFCWFFEFSFVFFTHYVGRLHYCCVLQIQLHTFIIIDMLNKKQSATSSQSQRDVLNKKRASAWNEGWESGWWQWSGEFKGKIPSVFRSQQVDKSITKIFIHQSYRTTWLHWTCRACAFVPTKWMTVRSGGVSFGTCGARVTPHF